jgi:hypothetical protein
MHRQTCTKEHKTRSKYSSASLLHKSIRAASDLGLGTSSRCTTNESPNVHSFHVLCTIIVMYIMHAQARVHHHTAMRGPLQNISYGIQFFFGHVCIYVCLHFIYVCMYVEMHVLHMYVCMHYTYVCAYVLHKCIHVLHMCIHGISSIKYTYACTYVCIHTYAHKHNFFFVCHVHTYLHVYMRTHACMYVNLCLGQGKAPWYPLAASESVTSLLGSVTQESGPIAIAIKHVKPLERVRVHTHSHSLSRHTYLYMSKHACIHLAFSSTVHERDKPPGGRHTHGTCWLSELLHTPMYAYVCMCVLSIRSRCTRVCQAA